MSISCNNWSFSFYEESFDDTYQSTDEEYHEDVSKTSILPEESILEMPGKESGVPINVYNPFLLTKISYFKRRSSKVKLRVYDKKVVVPRDKVLKRVHPM